MAEVERQIERQVAEQKNAEGKAAAKARVTGIKRARGSRLAEYEKQKERVLAARAAHAEAIETLNAFAAQIIGYDREAGALADRFALEPPTLPRLEEPGEEVGAPLPTLWRHVPASAHPQTEWDAHHKHQRRTYGEIAGTEGYAIIMAAGLKPWPPLTEFEEAQVLRAAEQQRRFADDMARETARVQPNLGSMR